MSLKLCSKCLEEKDTSFFYKQSSSKDGLNPRCKLCCKATNAEQYQKNREKVLANYHKNREGKLEGKRQWYYKNLLKILAYKAKHRERILDYKREWSRKNKGKRRIYQATRRARLRGQTEHYKLSDLFELLELQGHKCVYCEFDLRKGYQVDHILALARGGRNVKSNLQLLCRECNQSKGPKTHQEFLSYRKLKFPPAI